MRDLQLLAEDCYYEVKTRRLFGPRESVSDHREVIELLPGEILKCVCLYSDRRVKLASLVRSHGSTEYVIVERPAGKVPNWLSQVSPLKILAMAAE